MWIGILAIDTSETKAIIIYNFVYTTTISKYHNHNTAVVITIIIVIIISEHVKSGPYQNTGVIPSACCRPRTRERYLLYARTHTANSANRRKQNYGRSSCGATGRQRRRRRRRRRRRARRGGTRTGQPNVM